MGESQSHFVRFLELRGHLSADLFILSRIHSFTLIQPWRHWGEYNRAQCTTLLQLVKLSGKCRSCSGEKPHNCRVCGDGRQCRCQTQKSQTNGGSSLALTPLFDQELQQKDKVSLIPDADSSTQGLCLGEHKDLLKLHLVKVIKRRIRKLKVNPTENRKILNLPDHPQAQKEERGPEGAQVPMHEIRRWNPLLQSQGSIAGAPSAEGSGNQVSKLANPELALHDTLKQMIVDLKKTVGEDIVCHAVCMLGEIISYLGLPKSLITEEFVLERFINQNPRTYNSRYAKALVDEIQRT
ncbi:hypothetical protein ACRRTK_001727 [Alexandromys fortis]